MSTPTRPIHAPGIAAPIALARPIARQVLALATCALAAFSGRAHAQSRISTPPAATFAAISAADVVSWPQDARVTLDLRRVPLATLLALLGAQSGVRFRLAAIPDVEVSVSLQSVPLQQAVGDLLALHGFALRPGPDAFWLVAAPPVARASHSPDLFAPSPRPRLAAAQSATQEATQKATGAVANGESWRWWTGTDAPPPRWMIPSSGEQIAYESAPTASGVPGVAPFGVSVRLQPAEPQLARWKSSVQKFQSTTPGVLHAPATSVSLPNPDPSRATLPRTSPQWCARWPVFLRAVPARCLLVIESERPANLYLNGARLLRLWSGRRTLDLSQALAVGPNLLALEWPPQAAALDARSTSTAQAPPPVRFEWLVAQ